MLNKNKSLLGLILLFTLGFCLEGVAQSRSMSNIFIPENSFVSIFGEHSFVEGGNGVTPGIISTAKTGAKGYVIFAQGSSWTGASEVQFIDGYVQVYHNEPFVFPVGANGQYRPVAISGAALTSVAYFDGNPAKVTQRLIANKARTAAAATGEAIFIQEMSNTEYWKVTGQQATNLTFSWGSESHIDELTQGDLNKLSIIGWKNGKWEIIPSVYDIHSIDNATNLNNASVSLSSFSSGSITTSEAVTPDEYDYFTFGGLNTVAEVGETNFTMYPNPRLTRMPLNVQYQLPDEEGGTLRVFAVNGSILAERKLGDIRGIITLSEVTNTAGVYTVSITDSKGDTQSKKLIVVAE